MSNRLEALVRSLLEKLLAKPCVTMRQALRGRRRALVIPPSGPGSLGDAAMISVTVGRLRRSGFRQVDLASDVAWPLDHPTDALVDLQAGLHWGGRRAGIRAMMQVARYDRVVLIGADVIDGVYYLDDFIWRIGALALAARLGIGTAILGSSFSPTPDARAIAALRALPTDVTIYARDPISRQRMEAALGRPIVQTADLAFLLDAQADHASAAEALSWIARERQSGRSVVGLNVNFLHDRSVAGFADAMAVVLDRFLTQGISVVLVPHDSRTNRSDIDILTEMQSELTPSLRARTSLLACESAAAVKAVLASLDFLVTGRMHTAILAMSSGVPTLSFAYQGKFEGLYDLLGLGGKGLLLDPQSFAKDADDGANAIVAMLPKAPEFRLSLAPHRQSVLALAEQNFTNSSMPV